MRGWSAPAIAWGTNSKSPWTSIPTRTVLSTRATPSGTAAQGWAPNRHPCQPLHRGLRRQRPTPIRRLFVNRPSTWILDGVGLFGNVEDRESVTPPFHRAPLIHRVRLTDVDVTGYLGSNSATYILGSATGGLVGAADGAQITASQVCRPRVRHYRRWRAGWEIHQLVHRRMLRDGQGIRDGSHNPDRGPGRLEHHRDGFGELCDRDRFRNPVCWRLGWVQRGHGRGELCDRPRVGREERWGACRRTALNRPRRAQLLGHRYVGFGDRELRRRRDDDRSPRADGWRGHLCELEHGRQRTPPFGRGRAKGRGSALALRDERSISGAEGRFRDRRHGDLVGIRPSASGPPNPRGQR